MKFFPRTRVIVTTAALSVAAAIALAGQVIIWDTTIEAVSVTGAADTVNPGTTCIRVATALPAACDSNYIAIRNNNKELIAAALAAKTSGSRILLYYDNNGGPTPYHCPGLTFTNCSVVSIELR